ncbi:copper resistance protein NlpE N-terminal domain-containing protein [Sodalis glossinidius]|uniref:copper resistance protein NlpE N-terminal domain-containing protein n=1 Tax=Sodalis glossinidius TaxID=63612 RepID=UPI0002EB6361|nr:copper resistance protein NlpE N-terminal domain-containing protein [Sodalis glossinidius]
MKRLILILVIMLSGSILPSCHIAPPAGEGAFTPIQQYYLGTLPGENREEIETSLFLAENGTFIMQQLYSTGTRVGRVQSSAGQWARTADKLTLVENATGKKRFFRPVGNSLEILDDNGVMIPSAGCRFLLLPPRDRVMT